jgi:hypothetical protein
MIHPKKNNGKLNIEYFFAGLVMLGLVRSMYFLCIDGNLPYPFFYEINDTWMDWFNTSYWAHEGGAYDTWNTIYFPISFLIVKFLGVSSCYAHADISSVRQCDWIGISALHLMFFANIFLISYTFLKIDRNTALPRSIALATGLPMLFALDRGNLIIITFSTVLLAYGPLLKSARWRWIAAALSINLKIYLAVPLFCQLLRRRWRWFEGAFIYSILIYLVSYAALGSGSPAAVYNNIRGLTEVQASGFLDAWYSNTYTALMNLLTTDAIPIISLIGSDIVRFLELILPLCQRITQILVLLGLLFAWIRPESVAMSRMIALGISLVIITIEIQGYSQILLLLFVFMERWVGIGKIWALTMSYVLCLPFDVVLDRFGTHVRESFFAGHSIIFEFTLTLGPFIRPLILLSIVFALSCVTIREVWDDIQHQGWKFRWRYRKDAPIMVGYGAATPPKR